MRVIRKYTKERNFLTKPNENASTSLSVQNPDKHYTFLMQKSQNCVHVQVSTISTHYAFPIQNHQNCVLVPMSTIPKHYTFSIDKCPSYQMASFFSALLSTISLTTFFLCKITKIASILIKRPLYRSQHFFYAQSPQPFLFPNESLPKIAKIATWPSAHMGPLHFYLISTAIGL